MTAIVSCLTNSYGRFGAKVAIESVRDAGLEHVELPIRSPGQKTYFGDPPLVTVASSADELHRVDELLEKHGVTVSSCNVTSGNPLDRDVLDVTRRKLDVAARFGVELVVGGAGQAGSPQELETLYSNLREIGDHAAGLGIVYCFETHPGVCRDHRRMHETMETLDHANLKLNFDTGNLLYYNEDVNVEIALAKVCHHVRHMHLKDSQGEPGAWYFPALGCGGAVDFLYVFETMRDCGFRGPFSIEIEGIEGEGELTLQQYHDRIADSVDYLRACGFFD